MNERFGGFGALRALADAAAQAGVPPQIIQGAMQNAPEPNFIDPRSMAMDMQWYIGSVATLAPLATLQTTINIDAGTDFYWFATTSWADIGVAAQTESSIVIPLVNVVVTDTGSARQLMNAPVPLPLISGPGERPYRLPRPRLFKANSNISLSFTSYVTTGTTYSNVYMVFHGFRTQPNAGLPF